MQARIHFASGVLALLLALVPTASAETKITVEKTCPVCNTTFKAVVSGSGTAFGQRLDLRRVGAIASPWLIPVCTNCQFVLYKNNDKFAKAELESLRRIVNEGAYRQLDRKTPSYLRLALLYEGLKRPPDEVAFASLQASWQVEDDEKANRTLLERSLTWYEKYLALPPDEKKDWPIAEFLRGELLRRLGKLDEAKAQFERLSTLDEFKADPYPSMIGQELDLIRAKNTSPQKRKE